MGRLQFGEGILLVQQAATQQVGVEAGGQGPVSGGIFNWQTLAWQKPEGMALAASVALPESESKERSQGEQREKITRPRAVKREEAITVRGETGATGDASGGRRGREPFPSFSGVLWSLDRFALLQSCSFCLEYSSDPVLLT